MHPVRKLRRSFMRLRARLSRRFFSLWAKVVLAAILFFFIPFLLLSYFSISENIESEKSSLFQNFYLRAQALSLEIRTYLKDKVDLQHANRFLVVRGTFLNGYEIPVGEALRQKVLAWLTDREQPPALIEFYNAENGKPRILYLERRAHSHFFIFEAAFLSQLLDISHNIDAEDRIFIYNMHEEPFLSNSIEAEYQVPPDWQAGIHKLFWQSELSGIQELKLREQRFIIARYRLRELPLVIYVARPYAVAMHIVETKSMRLLLIFGFVGVIVLLIMVYFFRGQLRTLSYLRAFIDGRLPARRAGRLFLLRDERSVIFSDIIAIREHERKALEERDSAERRTRAKAEFLASMSHEIRNPLNAILGIADILRERTEDGEMLRYLTLIRDSGDSLLEIINDILDISKIESNKLTLEQRPFDVHKLLGDLQFFYAARAERQHNKIVLRIGRNVARNVIGDATRVRQIVINLLSNAVKFTENGTITLSVNRYAQSGFLHVFVHDTGIGISRENIARIFAAYEQAEDSTTRRFGGTGLGLSIALRLSDVMQGAIRCRSKIGQGTTFHCRLHLPEVTSPRSEQTAAVAVVHDTSLLAGLSILVAEDEEINRMLMVENLRSVVKSVSVAEDGRAALELAQNNHYDLIFMDILMPEMNGLDAVRELRRFEAAQPQARRVPVIALSGNAMPEDVAAAHAAGCDAHLAKPVRKEQLIAALLQFCRR
ncbi:MAG: ATP-binding protein [Turneriella sp.]